MAKTEAQPAKSGPDSPRAMLIQRRPLRYPNCSNPKPRSWRRDERNTADWADVQRRASALGVLLTRKRLEE